MLGNDPIFEVSEFVAVFNQSVEMAYPRIGIAGELANLRISRNRWVYFDLKDEEAQVKFFGTVRQLPGPLEDGLTLEVFGRPQLHPRYGFSVVIESISVSGKGSIKKARDLLEKKLAGEGLFDPARKRELPFAPEIIGLITAKDSAAFADFKKVLNARWSNCLVELIDVQVQGNESPVQIVQAIDEFNQRAHPPEVLVIVRGGGSPEDLASFNDERVVRAVSASRIPTLVGIGHEVDVSLAELAADARASTPSNAAEIVVPSKEHEQRVLGIQKSQIKEIIQKNIVRREENLVEFKKSIAQAMENISSRTEEKLNHSKSLLALLDPKAPLKRGYSLVYGADRKLVRSIKQVKAGDKLLISLADGTINSKAEDVADDK